MAIMTPVAEVRLARYPVTELAAYELSALRSGTFTPSRGLGSGLAPILRVAAAGDYSSPESLQRLEHELALRAQLDADWTAWPSTSLPP